MPSSGEILTGDPITDLAGFFAQFLKPEEEDVPPKDHLYVYRGHSDDKYKLHPGILRPESNRNDEMMVLREIHLMHPDAFAGDQTTFERLVRIQHYGLPTRLMDVSLNPLVALFFTCNSKKDIDGEFIRLSIPKRDVKYFDSHTVSVLANLSRLNEVERSNLRDNLLPDNLSRETKCRYLNGDDGSNEGRRLWEFILDEKPYFGRRIDPAHVSLTLLVKPKQNNPRIIAQQGAFLLFGLKDDPDWDTADIKIKRTPISATAKTTILKQLTQLNIHEGSLFPEMEKAAVYIKKYHLTTVDKI